MGYKAKIAKTVLSEWGEALGTKLFGKRIPNNVKPILGVGPNSMSKIDAMSFSKLRNNFFYNWSSSFSN